MQWRQVEPNLADPGADLLVGLGRQDLPAAVFAGFHIDVMRTATLAAFLVLDVSRCRQRIVRTPLATLHRGHLTARYCHSFAPKLASSAKRRGAAEHAAGTPNVLLLNRPGSVAFWRGSRALAGLIRKLDPERQSPRALLPAGEPGFTCVVSARCTPSGSKGQTACAPEPRWPAVASPGPAFRHCGSEDWGAPRPAAPPPARSGFSPVS